jgi:hypothetical protein
LEGNKDKMAQEAADNRMGRTMMDETATAKDKRATTVVAGQMIATQSKPPFDLAFNAGRNNGFGQALRAQTAAAGGLHVGWNQNPHSAVLSPAKSR